MTHPHLGAEAMTAPNDVAALVERLRAMPEKALLGGSFEADCLSAATTIAALQAEVERAKEERHLADNALVDRYRDPKTGSFQFPTDVAAIVRRLDAAEADRDQAEVALSTAFIAMRIAAALPAVSAEYDFGEAIEAACAVMGQKAVLARNSVRSASRKENTP